MHNHQAFYVRISSLKDVAANSTTPVLPTKHVCARKIPWALIHTLPVLAWPMPTEERISSPNVRAGAS
jgi:hypothetical protein